MPNALVIIMAETVRLDVGGMTCDGCSNIRLKMILSEFTFTALSGVVNRNRDMLLVTRTDVLLKLDFLRESHVFFDGSSFIISFVLLGGS